MRASLRTKCMARCRSVTVLSTIALLASAVAIPVTAIGHEWDSQWEVTVGRSADAVATDASGDVYVTGTVRSADGSWRSMVLVKYAADGEELWRRTWPAHVEGFPFSVGRDVAVSSDGESVYVAGAELDDSTENARATVWTYSAEGALLWRRAMWRSSSYVAEGIGAGPAGPVVGVMNRSEYPILRDGRVVAFDPDAPSSRLEGTMGPPPQGSPHPTTLRSTWWRKDPLAIAGRMSTRGRRSDAISASSFGTTNRASVPTPSLSDVHGASGRSISASAAVGNFVPSRSRSSPSALSHSARSSNAGL